MRKRNTSEQIDPRGGSVGIFDTFNGTDGDDHLVGTDRDDIFNPMLGDDTVDGRGGHDRLNIDYSSGDKFDYNAFIVDLAKNGQSYSGAIYETIAGTPSVTFDNVEELDCLGPLGSAHRGYGQVWLRLDEVGDAHITVNGNAVSIDRDCTFSGFKYYTIQLNTSANTFLGGAAIVTLSAEGTQDAIDGRGFHTITLGYDLRATTATDVTLAIDGSNGTITGGGHFSDAVVEYFYGGTGDNTFNTNVFSYMQTFGNSGRDSLNLDFSNHAGDEELKIEYSFRSDVFGGYMFEAGSRDVFHFSGYALEQDRFSWIGGRGNDSLEMSAVLSGIAADGGLGTDRLVFDRPARVHGQDRATPIIFTVDGTHATLANGDSFDNFESVTIVGGRGDDVFSGFVSPSGSGLVDSFSGRGGFDTVIYANASAGVTVSLVIKGAQDTGGAGLDQLSSIEGLIGSNFDDRLSGGRAGGMLDGGAGDDELHAAALASGAAGARLTGGSGADLFAFTRVADFATGASLDRITDFSSAEHDRIDLARIDADPGAAGYQGFVFIGRAAFDAAPDRSELRIEQAGKGDWLVQADLNHDGHADFAFLVHATQLQATDFSL